MSSSVWLSKYTAGVIDVHVRDSYPGGAHPGDYNQYPIGSYREIAIAIESEAGDSLTSIDQSGFSRKERNLHCDVHATYTSPLKTNTYCRRSGRQNRCG